jgi:acetate kinase
MGFTPLDGLPKGTRIGSFDPEIYSFPFRKWIF